MADLLLIIGSILPAHINLTEGSVNGPLSEGTRTLKAEHSDPGVYLLDKGIDTLGMDDFAIEDAACEDVLGGDRDGLIHKVVAVLWGTDARHGQDDFSWAFCEEDILLHSFAHVGENGEPWVEVWHRSVHRPG